MLCLFGVSKLYNQSLPILKILILFFFSFLFMVQRIEPRHLCMLVCVIVCVCVCVVLGFELGASCLLGGQVLYHLSCSLHQPSTTELHPSLKNPTCY
jgi:hypothetical protein